MRLRSQGSRPLPWLTALRSTACPVRWCQVLRSEEHTSELQSRQYLVCRLLLEKKKHDKHRRLCHVRDADAHDIRTVDVVAAVPQYQIGDKTRSEHVCTPVKTV